MREETELVACAAKGDVEAFGALFDRYAREVYRLACSMGHGGGDAEDLMQDTFLAALEGIARYEGRSTFKTWLLGILFRQSGQRTRYARRRETEVFDEHHISGDAGKGATVASLRHDSRMDVHATLNTLSPEHRAVVVLRELEGFSYDEIATTLAIPRGTVESRLFRARALLREQLHEYRSTPANGHVAQRKTVESRHE